MVESNPHLEHAFSAGQEGQLVEQHNPYVGMGGHLSNPAVSEKQRRFFGVEKGRRERGEKHQIDISDTKLNDFLHK